MIAYSAVLPAYNAARTIADSLQSILAQTCPPAEIIVVDDGSTDDTVACARAVSPLVQVLSQPNEGPAAATNRGIAAAVSPMIAFLDADDLWTPEKMARQLARMEAEPDIALLGCMQRQFRHGEVDDGQGEVRPGLARSGLVVRADAAARIGPMIDPPGRRADMVDWLARARWAGLRIEMYPEVMFLRRIIPGSLSHGRDPGRDLGYFTVVRAAMQRRRAAAAADSDRSDT